MKGFFRDKDGKVVIGQRPNLPLLTWVIAKLLMLLPALEGINGLLSMVAFGALFTWAWLEIFQGACMFRRVLGIVVMGYILSGF